MVQHGNASFTKDATMSFSDNEFNSVNPMTILPKPDEFDFSKPESWRLWRARFLRYGRLTARYWGYLERDWIDLLCYTMGEQSEKIMEEIMPDVTGKNLTDVLSAFTDYFGRMRNVTLQRYRFNSRTQLPEESVEQFVIVLHILAGSCQYGIMKDELIRDRIVAGLLDTKILEKLQLESCLTLENVIAIARQAEMQRNQQVEVSQDSSSACELDSAVERNEEQQFSGEEHNGYETLDQESCEYNNCGETGDLATGGEPESVSCPKAKDGRKSVEKDSKGCDMENDQETHRVAGKVEKISHHSSLPLQRIVEIGDVYNSHELGQLELGDANDEEGHVKAIYETVQQVMNDLKPLNFRESINHIRALQINSLTAMQIVVNLIHEKAVSKPSFSKALALMCKELALMQVIGPDGKPSKEESSNNLRKLIITQCQMEFEKKTVDKNARAITLEEIEACADPEKKKELQHILTEEETRIRIKSVGNIRFIGELFKQGILTTIILHRCICHLLTQMDEESLECLCKLLSTIGKDLESKNQNLDTYFKKMLDIVNRKVPGKVSSRVRFMLQDVIELRLNKWIPRRDDSNPKTMDQIQEEAETERWDMHMNNTPMNTPRKDDRNSDRKRNRGVGPTEEGGWSQLVRSRAQCSVKTSKIQNKPPPMDNLELGNKNMFQWSRNADGPKTITPNKFAMLDNMPSEQDKRSGLPLSGSRSTGPRDYKSSYDGRNSRNSSQQLGSRSSSRDSSLHDSSRSQSMSMPPPQPIKSNPPPAPASIPNKPAAVMTEEQLAKKAANILEEYLSDTNMNNAALEVRETFDNSTFANFVRETLNGVVEKSVTVRKQVSQLMTHLMSKNILPMSLYLVGLAEVLDMAEDRVIDIPQIWVYLAELIWYPLAEGVVPCSELKTTMAPLKNKGLAGKLMGELMIILVQEKGPKWIKDKWDQAGLEWGDFLREDESLNDFIKKYKLEFLFGDSNSDFGSLSGQLKLSMEQIHERLLSLMSNEKENSFDIICGWISVNVGERASEPQFIRVLMTAILEVSIEPHLGTFKFRADKFQNLQRLIPLNTHLHPVLELQCLIAIQEYIHKLEHPSGVLLQIIERLWDDSILSYDAFRAWESNEDPTAITGKSVAMMALTSFFTSLKEADDESSGEEA